MTLTAVIGGQWGDEGKGKIVDMLGENADLVARFQGGANAGHTIQIGTEETVLHQIPSGILRPGTHCLLGNGMVIDPVGLVHEIEEITARGIDVAGRLHLSLLAHVVTPLHKILDAYAESALGAGAIGTTRRGIGPCYADKIGRRGVRVHDLCDLKSLKTRLIARRYEILEQIPLPLPEQERLDHDLEQFYSAGEQIRPLAEDTVHLIHNYLQAGRPILAEGAQGTWLDVDFGTYPFVTASNTIAGGVCTGLGIGPNCIDQIMGVFKAYTTRVGGGPFPTELRDATGDLLQERGHEFGATTRRRRRCGWFDAVLGRYAVLINGFTSIAITKLDVLDTFPELQIAVSYKDGEWALLDQEKAVPEYRTLPGWQKPTDGARRFGDLPINAQRYLRSIEELLEVPVAYVSVGKARHQIIQL